MFVESREHRLAVSIHLVRDRRRGSCQIPASRSAEGSTRWRQRRPRVLATRLPSSRRGTVGEGATELVHIGQAVLNLGGTLDYFGENTFNYPTLAEAYKIAALDAWNRMFRV